MFPAGCSIVSQEHKIMALGQQHEIVYGFLVGHGFSKMHMPGYVVKYQIVPAPAGREPGTGDMRSPD